MLVVDLRISPQSEYTPHDFAFPVLEGATPAKYQCPPSIPPKGIDAYHMIFHKNLRHIVKIPLAHFLEPIADILGDEFLVLINDNIRRGGLLLGICRY